MTRVDRAARRAHAPRILTLCAAAAIGLATTGCRVNEDDIHRWEATAHGPDKLRAVLQHDKYDTGLRVEAAASLIRMKPRAGRRVGIGIMTETLAAVSPEMRQAIVASLIPQIINELKKPPPVAQAGQPSPPDPSFSYKDAAFAMLTHEGTPLVADDVLKQNLKTTLIAWAMADFVHRMENRTQSYGMEQLLRHLGSPGVAGLPKLMTRDAKKLDQMAGLVSELGDEKTKATASTAVVAIAQYVLSDEWTKNKKPELQAANAASKLEPTEKQFAAQLATYQDEELLRVFASMRKVGGRSVVDFALEFAAKKEQSEKRRQAVIAALEGRLDRNNPDDIKRVLQIAASDAPDVVLDQAFRRISEMPRELVVDKLYDLFKGDKWKIRRAAAGTVLRMSNVKHIEEFMGKLPHEGAAAKSFAMSEALNYGALLGELKEGKPLDKLTPFFSKGNVAQRTAALGYWYTHGTAADLSAVQPFEGEKQSVPACEDPECKWTCDIAKEGAKDPAKERENKEIKTVGDFVRYCIEPAMKERKAEAKK